MTEQAIRGTLAGGGRQSPAPFKPYVYRGSEPFQGGLGWCECGCGERAPIATKTDRRYGTVKGKPRRYAHGHNRTRTRAAA